MSAIKDSKLAIIGQEEVSWASRQMQVPVSYTHLRAHETR